MPDTNASNSKTYCCQMREKFLIGIIAENADVETPVDVVDFIACWNPLIIRIRFCPFCGREQDADDPVRILVKDGDEED